MRPALKAMIFVAFTLFGSSPGMLAAADPPDIAAPRPGAAILAVSQGDLQALQLRLDILKQQISLVDNYNQLEGPQDLVQAFILDVDRLSASLLPLQTQLRAQLGVLGPVPLDDVATEQSDIAAQRASLTEQKNKVDTTLKTLAALRDSATDLITQIAGIRRNLLESELTLSTRSVLNPGFWAPLLSPSPDDRQRLSLFIDQAQDVIKAAWQPGQRLFTTALLLLALVLWTLGRRLAERGLTWLCIHRMPEGRLRRSSLALASVLATVLTIGISLQLLFFALTRQSPLTPILMTFSQEFEKVVYACVLITALSRALLATQHPSWRLPAIADPVALSLKPFPRLMAVALLVLMTTVQVANASGMSSEVVLAGRAVIALTVSAIVVALLWQTGKVRRSVVASGDAPEAGTTFAGLLYAISGLAILITLVSLLIGYVSLARFITFELVWGFLIFSGFYLLMQLAKDSCEYLFSSRSPSGKALKQLLGIEDRRLEQISIIFSGVSRAGLLLLAVITLFVGGVGTTLGQLSTNVFAILGGGGLRKLNIIPGHLLNAVLALLIGIYLIRSLGRWLDKEFLPKTDMDPGMRASLTTLFANIGYALVILLTLSSLGVQWTNLAWIVSALSVGIGFGLQEIVKNFVSGLILLTERPVKVGDLISISGVEGDIRRINVRATEIQLSDRSIVIVPNSQLISQNLRNVTLGGSAQGVATLELTFPLDIDPEQVKDLLYDTYCEHETILDKPAPVVRFSKLTPEGITLTITGYVGSPRIVSTTKSDLLFEILKRLGAAGIELAKPTPAV
jgi:small-conductance mechanosensitive channel